VGLSARWFVDRVNTSIGRHGESRRLKRSRAAAQVRDDLRTRVGGDVRLQRGWNQWRKDRPLILLLGDSALIASTCVVHGKLNSVRQHNRDMRGVRKRKSHIALHMRRIDRHVFVVAKFIGKSAVNIRLRSQRRMCVPKIRRVHIFEISRMIVPEICWMSIANGGGMRIGGRRRRQNSR